MSVLPSNFFKKSKVYGLINYLSVVSKYMRIVFNVVFNLLFVLFSGVASAENIKPFTSDGCSSFPDGTFEHKELWLSCCTVHDYAYWQGGTYNERLIADKQLQQCVTNVGEPHIAQLMLAGVRVGGSPYFPTSFRWGYGWSYPRLYKALTAEEQKQIKLFNIISEDKPYYPAPKNNGYMHQ